MYLNKVFLIGRVGKDPEVLKSKSGTTVIKFGLATSESWKGKDGSKHDKTEWHNIVLFGQRTDFIQNAVKKGSLIHVEGKIASSEWSDKDGNKRKSTDIHASNITLLDKKEHNDGAHKPEPEHEQGQNPYTEDDIPF